MVTVINLDAQHGDSGSLFSGFPLNRMETHMALRGWRPPAESRVIYLIMPQLVGWLLHVYSCIQSSKS